MASAWGDAWGSAWGDSWGAVGAVVVPEPPYVPPAVMYGGGYLRESRIPKEVDDRLDRYLSRVAKVLKGKKRKKRIVITAETAPEQLEEIISVVTPLQLERARAILVEAEAEMARINVEYATIVRALLDYFIEEERRREEEDEEAAIEILLLAA